MLSIWPSAVAAKVSLVKSLLASVKTIMLNDLGDFISGKLVSLLQIFIVMSIHELVKHVNT